MSNIKYIIDLGNCDPGVNEDTAIRIPPEDISWDSTKYTFDNTVITFDHT